MPTVGSWGVAFSYERGTPVDRDSSERLLLPGKPLSGEYDTFKTVETRFWPWFQVKVLEFFKFFCLRSEAGVQDTPLKECPAAASFPIKWRWGQIDPPQVLGAYVCPPVGP